MIRACLLPLIFACPSLASAETKLIDLTALPSGLAYDVAKVTPLAMTAEGVPAMLIMSLKDGDVVPPHATDGGLRLLTVLSGTLSWGDGSSVDETSERTFGPGSLLTI